MNGRSVWLIPLALLGLLLGGTAATAQDPGKPNAARVLSHQQLADFIDQQIEAKWAKNKVTPAPRAGNAEFLRRAYLDLAGRIPKVADARDFFEDKSPDKRENLIEKLLDGPLYLDHFSNTWRALMISPQATPQGSFLGRNFQMWLVDQLRKDVPYDRLVYDILTVGTTPAAQPKPGQPYYNPYGSGSFAFFQSNQNKAEELASATSRIFLGVRLECAQCHDHPFSDWKREQFWQFAAFFSNTGFNQPKIQPPALGPSISIPGTQKTVNAKYLDGTEPEWKAGVHPRVTLAEWLTGPENPYFARTTANRLWGHFFGHGLIDPVDDEPSKENPPSHPELLQVLAEQLAAHQFDVKYLIRAITLSQTYQRSSKQTDESQQDPRLFAKMAVRGLTPEQLFDSLVQATGYHDKQTGNPVYYNLNSARSKFVTDFASTDLPTESQTSILQALKLMNGQFVADATSLDKSQMLAAVAETPFLSNEEKINVLFLATLTRPPTDSEMNQLATYVNSGGPRNDQKTALGDLFWALLNCSEFRLNH